MRQTFRLILVAAVAVLIANGSRAQQPDKYSRTNVFTFAPVPAPIDLTEIPRADIDKRLGAKAELKLRPNTATELYVWVLNPNQGDPKKDKDTFTVEMQVARGGPAVRTKVVIPASTWVRVRLPKPPAPAAPVIPVPPPPAAPAAKAPPAPEPPPPGLELPLTGGQSRLTFRLLDKNGDEILDAANGRPYGGDYTVSLRPPTDYVDTPDVKMTPGKGGVSLTAKVTQKPFGYPGSAVVNLLIPPQEALRGAFIREGFYRRTLTFDPSQAFTATNPAPAVTLSGRIENPGPNVRVYVGIDGIDRAFGYIVNPLGKTANTQVIPQVSPEVRVARVGVPAVTAPVTSYPVLIEVDNPSEDDALEFHLRPLGKGADLTEVVKLDSVRDVHVWLDPAGPRDGGLLFTNRSRDWIKPLDLSHLQGKIEVLGALRTKGGAVVESQKSLILTVDGTPPELVTFLPIPKTLEKGKPLPLAASVNDPETAISKATFYLFKAFDDGKIPADAVKAVGTQSLKNPKVWATDLKVPADFRGDGLVAVVFANEVGLATEPLVQRIEIVEAKPPFGTIEGVITYGERLQPGVAISLRDADGKEKAATTTDAKGRFKIINTPAGSYRVVALKKDSSTGAAGNVPVTVVPGTTTKVELGLAKIRQ